MITTSSKSLQLAQAYINRLIIAGATLTDAQRAAVTAVGQVVHEIGIGKFAAVYPFLGGSAALHLFDMLAAFNLTAVGTATHDANGVTGDGSSAYFRTGIIPSSNAILGQDSIHMAVYQRDGSSTTNGYAVGTVDSSTNRSAMTVARTDGDHYVALSDTTLSSVASGGDSQACFIANRNSASDQNLWKDGVRVINASETSNGEPNKEFFILALNNDGAPAFPSDNNLSFVSIGAGLTDDEVATLNAGIIAFQTALGRNV